MRARPPGPFSLESRQIRKERRDRIMAVIRDSLYRHKQAPSMREIRDRAEVSSTSVVKSDLQRLELEGRIRLTDTGAARGIWLVLGPDDACPYCGGRACAPS
jgi:SOS-response transcriptional repressor LexA